MNSQQKQLIEEIVRVFASHSGTEAVISSIASRNGMLAACMTLLDDLEKNGLESKEWVMDICDRHSVALHSFLEQLSQVVTMFRPTENITDYFSILGLEVGAGQEEIKKRYRKLSLRYHPDTAAEGAPDASEKFIQITQAYHILTGQTDIPNHPVAPSQASNWEPKLQKSRRAGGQRKLFLGALGLVVILLVFTTVTSKIYKKKAMLAGLQESSGAFVPPPEMHEVGLDKNSDAQLTPQPSTEKTVLTENQLAVSNVMELPDEKQIESETNDTLVHKTGAEEVDSDRSQFPTILAAIIEEEQCSDESLKNEFVLPTKSTEEKNANVLAKKQTSAPIDEKKIEIAALEVEQDHPKLIADVSTEREYPPVDQGVVSTTVTLKNTEPEIKNNSPIVEPQTNIFNDKQLIDSDAEMEKKASISAPQMAVGSESEELSEEVDLQEKIDTFLHNYIHAYEQRNLILFSRFFEADALENGKSFTTMLPTYMELFATTSNLNMDLTVLAWAEVDNGVSIDGRFKVELLYTDSKEISGAGRIHFVLKNNIDGYRISRMEYEFDR